MNHEQIELSILSSNAMLRAANTAILALQEEVRVLQMKIDDSPGSHWFGKAGEQDAKIHDLDNRLNALIQSTGYTQRHNEGQLSLHWTAVATANKRADKLEEKVRALNEEARTLRSAFNDLSECVSGMEEKVAKFEEDNKNTRMRLSLVQDQHNNYAKMLVGHETDINNLRKELGDKVEELKEIMDIVEGESKQRDNILRRDVENQKFHIVRESLSQQEAR